MREIKILWWGVYWGNFSRWAGIEKIVSWLGGDFLNTPSKDNHVTEYPEIKIFFLKTTLNTKLDGCPSLPFQPDPSFVRIAEVYHRPLDPFLQGEILFLGEVVIFLCLEGGDDCKDLVESFLSGGKSVKIPTLIVLTCKSVVQFLVHHEFENIW